MPVINAAQAFNVPKDVTFGDETIYKLYELDANDLGEFEAWANGLLLGQFEELWKTLGPLLALAAPKQADDPSALAVIEALKYLERIAAERTHTYYQIGSAEISGLLTTWVGARELLYLSIKHGRPEFTRGQAFDLFGTCSVAFIMSLPELVGLVSRSAEGQPDPKAPSADAPTLGATPSSTDGAPAAASTSSSSSASSS